mgnify:CR=1 FL=1
MSTMKIKTGDTVKVIAGKDKDKEGKVLSLIHISEPTRQSYRRK